MAKGEHVLLVEDSRSFANILKDLIAKTHGFEVEVASNFLTGITSRSEGIQCYGTSGEYCGLLPRLEKHQDPALFVFDGCLVLHAFSNRGNCHMKNLGQEFCGVSTPFQSADLLASTPECLGRIG